MYKLLTSDKATLTKNNPSILRSETCVQVANVKINYKTIHRTTGRIHFLVAHNK